VSTGVGGEKISKVRALNIPREMSADPGCSQVDPLDLGAERLGRSNLKRLLDIVGAFAGLVVLAPLLLLVAVLIVMESPGSPIFRQRRSGYRGAPFVIYKFRTMRVAEDGPNVVQARREDSRITLVGALLRRTSVDELPQLVNVLKGEMSLVGPRPHALAHDEYYGARITEYHARFRAKPGLTGLAQVSGLRGPTPDVATMAARIEKDLDYIREWSILLDLRILCQTGLIFAFHPAAY
jgi:putative colanic acid biosynthesis UDP-glucose lipid carrier transferase